MYPERGVYRFVPYNPPSGWWTETGVPGAQAMIEAGRLLEVQDIRRLEVRAISHRGKAIGYQVSPPRELPDQRSYYYEISYFLRGDMVRIQIVPAPYYYGY